MAAVTTVLPEKSLPAHVASKAAFAHPTEEMFARLLDFHGIQWQYEPRTFGVEVRYKFF